MVTTITRAKDKKKPEDTAGLRARCQAQGGTWNAATKTCTLPERKGAAPGATQAEKAAAARQVTPQVASKVQKEGTEAKQETAAQQAAITSAEALGFDKQAPQPTPEPIQPQPQEGVLEIEEAPGILSLEGVENLIAGRPVSIGGKTFQTGARGTVGEEEAGLRTPVLGEAVPIGPGAGAAGILPSLFPEGAKGAAATAGVKKTLKSPGILKNLLAAAKKNPIISGFLGVELASKAKDFSSDVLLRNIKKLDSELGKMGEEITAYDAKAQNGFYIDENGNAIEYSTKDALKDLDDTYNFLNEAERKMQEANIYQKFFLLASGEDINIMAEIQKLRTEVQEETGNIIATQLQQPDTLTASNDFFRRLEMEGYDVN